MKKLLAIVAVVIIITFIYLNRGSDIEQVTHVPSENARRDTTLGPVIGFEDSNQTYAWLGLPFAQPPIGDLRWRAPRPASPWQETRDATAYNNACVQQWGPLAGMQGEEGDVVGNEDCLYLNLWSPRSAQQASAKLPVMVWIHGGGNTIGTANTYPADILSGGENVVVVTINYRLGLLGWMSHPALRNQDDLADGSLSLADGSANFGVLDMIAALKWIKDNIANFGGDPNSVTIFGESAGGRDVYSLLFSPLANGLFHKAISQSGRTDTTPLWRAENFTDDAKPGMDLSSKEWLIKQLQDAGLAKDRNAAKVALTIMTNSEIFEFMHSRTPEQILEGVKGFAGMYRAPESIRDGIVLPLESQLSKLSSTDTYNSVPLMTGTNRDEMKLFMAQDPEHIEKRFGIFPRIKDLDAYNRATAYPSDLWKANAVDEVATAMSKHPQQNVYAYRWDWDEGSKGWTVDYTTLVGAGHGLEVPFVFGTFNTGSFLPGLYNQENKPGREELSRQMRSYWSEFARTGSPGKGRKGDLVEWQAWQNGKDNLMLLDTTEGGGTRMVNQPMTVTSLKNRVTNDQTLSQKKKCYMFAEMFFKPNSGDDIWDQDEFQSLGCSGQDPWRMEPG